MNRDDITPKEETAMDAALHHLALATGSVTPAGLPADLPATEVERYVESLALLAYSVDPAAPSPRVKTSILEQARAEPKPRPSATPLTPADAASADAAPADAASVDVTLRHAAVTGRSPAADLREERDAADMTLFGLGDASVRAPVPANDARGLRRAVWALAAGLIVCLVALGYLYGQLDAGDGASTEQVELEQAELARALERARQRTALMEDRLEMVTTVARLAYPMHRASTAATASVGTDPGAAASVGTDPGAATYPGTDLDRPLPGSGEPDGIIYVCGQHERWYLSLDNLEPAPPGQDYHLWFLTGEGEVDAGPLQVAEDGSVDLHDLEMPAGTHGFLVSLEDAEDPATPRRQIVLRADQAVKL